MKRKVPSFLTPLTLILTVVLEELGSRCNEGAEGAGDGKRRGAVRISEGGLS